MKMNKDQWLTKREFRQMQQSKAQEWFKTKPNALEAQTPSAVAQVPDAVIATAQRLASESKEEAYWQWFTLQPLEVKRRVWILVGNANGETAPLTLMPNVPVALAEAEALALWFSKLTPDGKALAYDLGQSPAPEKGE